MEATHPAFGLRGQANYQWKTLAEAKDPQPAMWEWAYQAMAW